MTNRAISIFNQLRPVSVGFDSVFDHFGSMFEDDMFDISVPNYPPYNIVKVKDNHYNIEVALAGYNKNREKTKTSKVFDEIKISIRVVGQYF